MSDRRPVLPADRRALLAEDQATWIEGRAAALQAEFRWRSEEWLRASRDVLGDPFDRFDHDAARLTRQLAGERAARVQERLRLFRRDPSGWLERHGERAARVLALTHALEGQAQTSTRQTAEPRQPVSEGLESLRDVLGNRRIDAIAARAAVFAPMVAAADTKTLEGWRTEYARHLASLDWAAAREALNIERAREDHSLRMTALEAQVEQLERTGYRPGYAGFLRERANGTSEALDGLRRRDQALRDEGRHPDRWVERGLSSTGFWAAVDAELAARERNRERAEAAPPEADQGPAYGI